MIRCGKYPLLRTDPLQFIATTNQIAAISKPLATGTWEDGEDK